MRMLFMMSFMFAATGAGLTLPAFAEPYMFCSFTFLPSAESQKKPEGPWILDDIDKGFAQAKKTGKPLMVVFR